MLRIALEYYTLPRSNTSFTSSLHDSQLCAMASAGAAAAENKVDAILARLAEIVQELDMDITTQRQITNKLAEEFGEDVYEYKALIKVVSATCHRLTPIWQRVDVYKQTYSIS